MDSMIPAKYPCSIFYPGLGLNLDVLAQTLPEFLVKLNLSG